MGENKLEESILMPTVSTSIQYGKQIMNLQVLTFQAVISDPLVMVLRELR